MSLRVEDVRCQEGAEVDDDLFGGWHETLGESTQHLIRVQLLVNTSLEGSVILILREERLGITITRRLLPGAKAGRHGCSVLFAKVSDLLQCSVSASEDGAPSQCT